MTSRKTPRSLRGDLTRAFWVFGGLLVLLFAGIVIFTALVVGSIVLAIALDDSAVIGSWLPFYHDMGLIGNLLYAVYANSRFVFMPPAAFIQKPLRWLHLISRYRVTASSSPNPMEAQAMTWTLRSSLPTKSASR